MERMTEVGCGADMSARPAVGVRCGGMCRQIIFGPDRASVEALLASHAEADGCPHTDDDDVEWVHYDDESWDVQASVRAAIARRKRTEFMHRGPAL